MMFAAYLLVLTGAACLIPGYTTWATTGVFTVTGFTALGILTTITGMGVAVVADYRATGRELVEYTDTLAEVKS